MQPIIVTFIEKKNDNIHVEEIIKESNKQFEEMGIAPLIYVYTHYPYASNFANVFVKSCLEESFEVLSKRHPSSYIIRQYANVRVKEHIYKWIHTEMMNGTNAILFHWQNPIHPHGCWHLNFFITKDSKYYPKWDIDKDIHDCAEVRWGKYLIEHNLTSFTKSHNSSDKKFYIAPEIPYIQEVYEEGVEVIETISKPDSWFKIIKRWFIGLLTGEI